MSRATRIWLAVAAVAVLVMATTAFTQGMTVNSTSASAGNSAIGSYSVSNFRYTLLSGDYDNLGDVTFVLSGPALQVYAGFSRVSDGTTFWWSCSPLGPVVNHKWRCAGSSAVLVEDLASLKIVATDR